ncbi:MAG TPA: hypothetical protein EYM40_03030 [Candidatus Poseidoniales archaeon]|nr:hypothetical protein [Candidatus Thalassarchaeum sp.]NRB11843.1 hypothetical protein [Candidatus Thalassarchaeum sp.]HIM64465.1 hypothetical protein [Candidatus Poseidoniales archaeon]
MLEKVLGLGIDRVLLDALYRDRLRGLRNRAEEAGLSKSGSVEVVRARLIQHHILGDDDLSWEGIQSMTHKEIGEVLKVFGIKSSGSHKERRQRLWLHLNFDSRRLTVERLAEMDRDTLQELCQKLEARVTGSRTVLMARVGGVLTNQANGWGRIKRSLWRSGIPDVSEGVAEVEFEDVVEEVEAEFEESSAEPEEEVDFQRTAAEAVLEDASDALVFDLDKAESSVQGALLTIQARVEDLERMVGTILRGHGGHWGEEEQILLIKLAERRGWPLDEDEVRSRVRRVATNIAEIKGGSLGERESRSRINSDATLERVREKMRHAETLLSESPED